MSKQGIVNIRGKEYKTVALRVQEFKEKFPSYFLTTEIVKIDDEQCIIKAYAGIHTDNGNVQTFATGHAQRHHKLMVRLMWKIVKPQQ
jgi:cobalamin biosynthesis Co2+ chelatase CbiK